MNEFVVQLFTRNYKEHEIFVSSGYDIDKVTLITEGAAHCVSKENFFFMVLPPGCVFGDFNAAFDVKTLIGLRGPPNPPGIRLTAGREFFTCSTMNCDKEIF